MQPFVSALGTAYGLTSKEIADIIWLALQMQNSDGTAETTTRLESSISARTTEARSRPSPENFTPSSDRDDHPDRSSKIKSAEVHLNQASFGKQLALKVPDARSLREPLSLARSLKPLLRRVVTGWSTFLDEAATVDRIAAEQLWLPVLKPALEPWLDLALVVDESASMQLWQRTIADLQRLLSHYGVFRDVRVWGLVTDAQGQVQLRPGLGAAARQQAVRRPSELLDPSGRRLILVATDCVSSGWQDGSLLPALKLWATSGPLAIVQMLPEWLWSRTGLGFASAIRLQALLPGVPNQQLIAKDLSPWDEVDLEAGLKVPVVTLEPEPFAAWTEMVMGKGGAWSPGFVFEPEGVNPNGQVAQLPDATVEDSAEQRAQRFRVTASPMARRLAGLLAAAPVISLPVVRIIQDRLLSESRQVHVAEVFLGGLLKPLGELGAEMNQDAVQYDFLNGVREALLESVPTSNSVNVLEEVSKFVAERLGLSLDAFSAVLRNPQQAEDRELVSQSRPFAMVTAQILRQLGGEYAQFAEELEQLNQQSLQQSPSDITNEQDYSYTWNCIQTFAGHEENITCVCFSPDGQFIASASDDSTVRLWDLQGNQLWQFTKHESLVHFVTFSPNGQLIASASADQTVRLLDLKGNELIVFRDFSGAVKSVAFSSDGQLIGAACTDGTATLWNLQGEKIQSAKMIHSLEAIIFNRDSVWVIFGDSDGKIYKNHVPQRGAIVRYTEGHDGTIYSISLSPKDDWIATAGEDATIRLWDLDGINPIGKPFRGHKAIIWSIAFNPNGQLIASGSRDQSIRLWDLKGNAASSPLLGHQGGVNCVAFSPDGKIIVSCSSDKTIKLWGYESPVESGNKIPPISQESSQIRDKTRKSILFLPANPNRDSEQILLTQEVQTIQTRLQLLGKESNFKIFSHWAANFTELKQSLLDHKPQIIYFFDYTASEGLTLENSDGEVELVSSEALGDLFRLFENTVECVLFNGCYLETQAEAISQYVPYVIGISSIMEDHVSIEFVVGFYEALGSGLSYQDAHKVSANAIKQNNSEFLVPMLKRKSAEKRRNFQRVQCTGIAKLESLETGKVFEVTPDDLNWETECHDPDRQMGAEFCNSATVYFEDGDGGHCIEATWTLYEYPIGILSSELDCEMEGCKLLQDFDDYWLTGEEETLDEAWLAEEEEILPVNQLKNEVSESVTESHEFDEF